MQRSIVYLAHGADRFHKQARFSIYSALSFLLESNPGKAKILVYTDRPDKFENNDLVSVLPLKRRDLKGMKGPAGYVHRAKLAVLARATEDFPGPLLYIDCDTKWVRNPDTALRLLDTPSDEARPVMLMHEYESRLGPDVWPDYFRELSEGYEFQRRLGIENPWVMWNSGVIGMAKPRDFFSEALAMSDEMLPRTARKNWTEQLAVSLLGHTRYNIRPLSGHVRHYWQHTFELPYVVDSALRKAQWHPELADRAGYCARFPVRDQIARMRVTPRMKLDRFLRRFHHSLAKRRLHLLSGD